LALRGIPQPAFLPRHAAHTAGLAGPGSDCTTGPEAGKPYTGPSVSELNCIQDLGRSAERPEDLPLLVEHFFALANQEEGTDVRPPATAAMAHITRMCGDLSIRVLKNAIRRLVVLKRGGQTRPEDLAAAGIVAEGRRRTVSGGRLSARPLP